MLTIASTIHATLAGRSPPTASRRPPSGPGYAAAAGRRARVLSANALVSMSVLAGPGRLLPSPKSERPRATIRRLGSPGLRRQTPDLARPPAGPAIGEDRDSAAACSAFADVGVGAATEESVSCGLSRERPPIRRLPSNREQRSGAAGARCLLSCAPRLRSGRLEINQRTAQRSTAGREPVVRSAPGCGAR